MDKEPMMAILGKLGIEFKEYPKLDNSLKIEFIADVEKYKGTVGEGDVLSELDKYAVFINKYVLRSTTMEFFSRKISSFLHGYYFHQNGEVYHLDYSPKFGEIVYQPDYLIALTNMGIKVKGYLQSRMRDHTDKI